MEKEHKCSYCNCHFQNGEYVSKLDGRKGFYHITTRLLDENPVSCLMAAVSNGQLGFGRRNNYLYYKKKLYNLLVIDMLPNFQQLQVDFNDNKNGDKLIGNLEGLVNKSFFSRILSRIFDN